MDIKHKGSRSELIACAWLLEQGYEVFRNVSSHGMIDIIARHASTGEIVLLDVKTLSTHTTPQGLQYKSATKLSEEQVKSGVKSLNVDGFECFIESGEKSCYKVPGIVSVSTRERPKDYGYTSNFKLFEQIEQLDPNLR